MYFRYLQWPVLKDIKLKIGEENKYGQDNAE